MLKLGLILCSILICFQQIDCVLNPKVVCYYENWFVWRTNDGKMTVNDVDSSLCTHIVYSYLGVSTANEISLPDPYLMVDLKDLSKFSANKGSAKALAAIGGYTLSGNFETMVSSDYNRQHFVDDVIKFLTTYNFDGITLDWYKNEAWSAYSMENFHKLLVTLHQAFNGKYVLGITVTSRPVGFNASLVDSVVDFFDIQTFDFHGSWEDHVGHQAPFDWQYSIMREWEAAHTTPSKLLMTIPLFAHTWELENPAHSEPGAKASGPGQQGPFSQASGKLNFNELCVMIKQEPSAWHLHVDANASGAAYAVHDRLWVTFESVSSAGEKAHNITSEGYGGVVVQALAAEDFRGLCGQKYPLLKAINEKLNKEDTKGRTRPPPISTTPFTVTADPNKVCQKEGNVKDPHDCTVYHKCLEFFPGNFQDEIVHCPTGQGYDQTDDKCKDKAQVAGCH